MGVGAAVQALFPLLLCRYFQFDKIAWSPSFAVEGIAAGILVTLLFTIPPLVAIRKVKPALIFRREMAELKPPWPSASGISFRRCSPEPSSWPASAEWRAGWPSRRAWAALHRRPGCGAADSGRRSLAPLRGLREFLRWSPLRLPVALRHGVANLYRPGNHAASVLVALGIGVMFTLTIYLVQKSLLVEVIGAAPPGSPNVFLINITPREQAVSPGSWNPGPIFRPARDSCRWFGRAFAVDGKPVEEIERGRNANHPRHARQVTWIEARPADIQVRRGACGPPATPHRLFPSPSARPPV